MEKIIKTRKRMLPLLIKNSNSSFDMIDFRMDDDFNVNNATEEELKEYIDELESELEFYKPMFIALTVLVCSVLVFLCLLIIPGRRRKKFRELLRVQQMEEAAEEEKMRQLNENFTLGVKDEQDSGMGNSADNGSHKSSNKSSLSSERKKERRKKIEKMRNMRSVNENDTDTDGAGGGGTLYMTAEVQQHINELKQDQQQMQNQHEAAYKKPSREKSVEELMLNARRLPNYEDTDEDNKNKSAGGDMSNYYEVAPPAAPMVMDVPALVLTRASEDSGQPNFEIK